MVLLSGLGCPSRKKCRALVRLDLRISRLLVFLDLKTIINDLVAIDPEAIYLRVNVG